MGRKEGFRKKNSLIKRLIGVVLLIGLIGSSISVAFAEQDIQQLFTKWFEMRKQESFNEISLAIDGEQEIQSIRLKEELQSAIDKAQEDLHSFTETEIQKRKDNLREYADQLISQMDVSTVEEENRILAELESIYSDAVNRLANVQLKDSESEKTEEQPADNEDEGEQGSKVGEDETDIEVGEDEKEIIVGDDETEIEVEENETEIEVGDGEP